MGIARKSACGGASVMKWNGRERAPRTGDTEVIHRSYDEYLYKCIELDGRSESSLLAEVQTLARAAHYVIVVVAANFELAIET
jgi:hypothetical protein